MKMKQQRLKCDIYRLKQVTKSDLEIGERGTLDALIAKGQVVEAGAGSWSGEKYYKLSDREQMFLDNWYGR